MEEFKPVTESVTMHAPTRPGGWPIQSRTWEDAGPPPVAKTRGKGVPTWALVLMSVGACLVIACCGFNAVIMVVGDPETAGVDSPEPAVEVTGDCRKRIVGSYRLAASITALNPTDEEVEGTMWVRWEVLGDDPHVFSQRATLAPGESMDFRMDEEIGSSHWFDVGECDYGWNPLPQEGSGTD